MCVHPPDVESSKPLQTFRAVLALPSCLLVPHDTEAGSTLTRSGTAPWIAAHRVTAYRAELELV
jgi:hypothetical protein